MPLKTLNELPPGGWIYEQKDAQNRILKKFRSMSPFREAANEIVKFRQNNSLPRATFDEAAEDLEAFTVTRLGFDSRYCQTQKKTAFNFSPERMFRTSVQHLRESAEAVARRSSQVVSGALILRDWLGDGAVPVSRELAQNRADVCTKGFKDKDGNPAPCPFNKPGFSPIESIAETIRVQVEKKNEMQLSVEGEENLYSCDICWCHLPLKIHVPLETIMQDTPGPMLDKFQQDQPACWIVTEQQSTP